MSEALETTTYKNLTIEIYSDISSENPIKFWDTLGEYVCWHQRYDLGNSSRFKTPEEVVSYAKRTNSLLFPLYMYDHSGISLSLSNSNYPFNDKWDAGQVGFVLVDRNKALKFFSKKKFTTQLKQKIEMVIAGEIETYNQFLAGDVYGYVISKDGEEIDSCWGYYGQDYCLSEAKACVDDEVLRSIVNHSCKVKKWIKGKVPLIHRHKLGWC
jgi:hypothetical protein